MRKDSSEKLTGNAQFEGYSLDLIYEISRILGFNYTFNLVPDGRYGSYNKKTKEWDGMMKELLDQKADLAIADLTITYDREQVVDFTMPFMNLGERFVWSTTLRALFIFNSTELIRLCMQRDSGRFFEVFENFAPSFQFEFSSENRTNG